MILHDYIQNHVKSGRVLEKVHPDSPIHRFPAKPIVCADGFTMSVQASASHYCSPRDNDGPYNTVEVGYPSEREESLMPYASNEDTPTDTVYSMVPIEVIKYLIYKHGGLK
jgi:hypothetical protein